MRLMLVRHGETAHNRSGIVQGRNDVPLNEHGMRQAAALAAALKGAGVRAIISSPLQRARDTAEAIAAMTGAAVAVSPGVTEMDVGAMDGLALPEIRTRFGAFLADWRADTTATKPLPDGEDLTSLQTRAIAVVTELEDRYPEDLVLIVSHQFTIQAILCRLLDVPLINFERFSLSPASKTLLDVRGGGGTLVYLNDCCHHPDDID